MKYKVGDKVRLTGAKSLGFSWSEWGDTLAERTKRFLYVGSVVTVEKITMLSNTTHIYFKEFGGVGAFAEKDVEPIEKPREEKKMEIDFKIGDRVVRNDGSYAGIRGVVFKIDDNTTDVKLDDNSATRAGKDTWSMGHNCWDLVRTEENKMKAPETNMEKEALKQAKAEVIQEDVDRKAKDYKREFERLLNKEKLARSYRKESDELAKLLSVTKADLDKLL